jgi:small subunit ribosomal protein S21
MVHTKAFAGSRRKDGAAWGAVLRHAVECAKRAPAAKRKEVTAQMTTVRVKEGETIEAALKRFKKATEKAGILSEVRKREHYEKPSVRRKKKEIAAKKRAVKKTRKA